MFHHCPLGPSNRCHMAKALRLASEKPELPEKERSWAMKAELRLLCDKMTPSLLTVPHAPMYSCSAPTEGALQLYAEAFWASENILGQVLDKCPQALQCLPAWPGSLTSLGPKGWEDPTAWLFPNHCNLRVVLACQAKHWDGHVSNYALARSCSSGRLMAIAAALSICPSGMVYWPSGHRGTASQPLPVTALVLYNKHKQTKEPEPG